MAIKNPNTNGDVIDFFEMPSVIWRKEYETNHKKLAMLIQHLSDYMILVSSDPWDTVRNPKVNQSMFDGTLNEKEVDELFSGLLYAFGEKGAGEFMDYKFFKQDYEAIEATLLKQPFEVSFKAASAVYEEKRFSKATERVAAFLRNAAIDEVMKETGENLEDLKDYSAVQTSRIDSLLSQLNGPDQLELVTSRLIKSFNKLYNFDEEFRKCGKDQFVKNAMYAHIDDSDGTPRLRYISPSNVRFISPVPVETMDDPNIIAWSISNYISIGNALQKYGSSLSTHRGMGSINKMIKALRNGLDSDEFQYYNPYMFVGDQDPIISTIEQTDTFEGVDLYVAASNMNAFYQKIGNGGRGNIPFGILEQKIYFKVVKHDLCLVKINGKNPTKDQVNAMKYGMKIDGTEYIKVEDDYKAKSSEMTRTIPYEELWEATRLGHSVFLNIGKYKYQTRYEKNHRKVFPPLIGRIFGGESMVSVARSYYIAYNKLMYTADEKVNTAGMSEVLLSDAAQAITSLKEAMLSAKKHGVLEFDSSKFSAKENSMAGRHLQTVKLGESVDQILKYYEAAQVIKQAWGNMVGLSGAMKGQSGQYESAAKVDRMINQSSLVMYPYMWNNYLFRKDALKRYADIIRKHVAENPESVSSLWDSSSQEVIKLSKDLSLVDMEIDMAYGYIALEDKEFILSAVNAGVASGVTDLETLIETRLAGSPSEIKAILREAKQKAMDAQERNLQMQSQSQQQIAQIDQQAKLQVPIEKEKIKAEAAIAVAEIRAGQQEEDRNFKGDMADIEEANSRQRAVLDTVLQQESQPPANPQQ